MTNVFPLIYDLCKKIKKTMLLLNNSVFREYNQIQRFFFQRLFNHYGLTTNKFSTDIVRILSKINCFSIGDCATFIGHVRCPTIISHPVALLTKVTFFISCHTLLKWKNACNENVLMTIHFLIRKPKNCAKIGLKKHEIVV